MELNKFSKLYDGPIKTIPFDIDALVDMHRDEYLKKIWEENRGSTKPVLVIVPFLEHGAWKNIQFTKIFLTCDTEGLDLEHELRILLAPKPSFIERLQISINNFFNPRNKISILRSRYSVQSVPAFL